MAQFAFGVFITPLEEEFGWSRTEINIALALGVVQAFISPFVGRLMDRYGARWIMVGSLGFIVAGFLLRAVMTDLWQFYLFSTLIFIGTPGSTMMPAGRLVGIWFPRTRGRMMGIVTSGNNFGGMVTVPLAAAMIAFTGWRWSFFGIAIVMMAVMVLAFVVIRDRPEDVGREAGKRWAPKGQSASAARAALSGYTAGQAAHMPAFWFLMFAMTVQQFARTAVSTQMIPHLEQEGFSIGLAAAAISMVSFFGMASKIISGRVSEIFTARYTYVAIIAIQMTATGSIVLAGGSIGVGFALALVGLGMGGVGALGPLAITEMFGLRNFGSILGLTRPAMVLPLVAGPIMAGVIFDVTGEYDLAFLITIALLGISIVAFLLARPTAPAAGNDRVTLDWPSAK